MPASKSDQLGMGEAFETCWMRVWIAVLRDGGAGLGLAWRDFSRAMRKAVSATSFLWAFWKTVEDSGLVWMSCQRLLHP